METIFGLKPVQLVVFGLVSEISIVFIPAPWLWLALAVCFAVAVILQQRNIKLQRQLAKQAQRSTERLWRDGKMP